MRFFFDNNLSPRLARAIDALEGNQGNRVSHLRDLYSRNTPDAEWMSAIGRESGWVVITADYRITRNKDEVAAWEESGLTIFFLRKGWLQVPFWEQASRLIKLWPQITELSGRYTRNKRFLVPFKGKPFDEL